MQQAAGAVSAAAVFINRPHLCRQRCSGFGNQTASQAAAINLLAVAGFNLERRGDGKGTILGLNNA